jgi:hypothetical protein
MAMSNFSFAEEGIEGLHRTMILPDDTAAC